MASLPFKIKTLVFLLQKRFSSTIPSVSSLSSSSAPSSTSFTVDYLVKSCGVPFESAIAASKKLHLNEKNLQRHDSVLNLFKSHGFDNTHIRIMIQRFPNLLSRYNPDEILRPKIEYLVENGFSGPDLHDLIVSNPSILSRSLDFHLKPSLDFIRSILGSRVKATVMREPRMLTNDLKGTLEPNIDLLVREGVAVDAIADFIVTWPSLMMVRVHRMVEAVKVVREEVGMDPSAAPKMFLYAASLMAKVGVALWRKRVEVLMASGLSHQDVLYIFRNFPSCFQYNEETLKSKLDFYFSTFGMKPDDIVSYPKLITSSIDKKVVPRHNVLKVLFKEKLLREEDVILGRVFCITEDKFINKYVAGNSMQVPNLLELYIADKSAKKVGV